MSAFKFPLTSVFSFAGLTLVSRPTQSFVEDTFKFSPSVQEFRNLPQDGKVYYKKLGDVIPVCVALEESLPDLMNVRKILPRPFFETQYRAAVSRSVSADKRALEVSRTDFVLSVNMMTLESLIPDLDFFLYYAPEVLTNLLLRPETVGASLKASSFDKLLEQTNPETGTLAGAELWPIFSLKYSIDLYGTAPTKYQFTPLWDSRRYLTIDQRTVISAIFQEEIKDLIDVLPDAEFRFRAQELNRKLQNFSTDAILQDFGGPLCRQKLRAADLIRIMNAASLRFSPNTIIQPNELQLSFPEVVQVALRQAVLSDTPEVAAAVRQLANARGFYKPGSMTRL